MRDILYLDVNFVSSFNAQFTYGDRTNTVSQGANTSEENDVDPKVEAVFQIGLVKAGASTGEGKTVTTSSLIDTATYIKHDEILTTFLKNAKENIFLKENCKVGEMISCKTNYKFFSFSRVNSIFAKYPQDVVLNNNGEIDNFLSQMSRFQDAIPYDSFLYYDNLLILLNEDWLRDSVTRISFKFGSEYTVVGIVDKYVNIEMITNENAPKINNVLDFIQSKTFMQLKEMGFIASKEVHLVTPIAIYREFALDPH